MNYLLIILLSLTAYISAIEYSAVHEQTYWYYDDEITAEGWHMGTVRSNLVHGDKLRFAISEKTCDQIPAMYFTLSSNQIPEIRKDNPDFNIKSMEGKKIGFRAYIDEFDPFMIDATINIADDVYLDRSIAVDDNSDYSMFFIQFDEGMPRNFINYALLKDESDEFIQVMMLEIPEDDPNYKYFDLTQIKFRMGGLLNVWMHAHELCLDAGKGKSND